MRWDLGTVLGFGDGSNFPKMGFGDGSNLGFGDGSDFPKMYRT